MSFRIEHYVSQKLKGDKTAFSPQNISPTLTKCSLCLTVVAQFDLLDDVTTLLTLLSDTAAGNSGGS